MGETKETCTVVGTSFLLERRHSDVEEEIIYGRREMGRDETRVRRDKGGLPSSETITGEDVGTEIGRNDVAIWLWPPGFAHWSKPRRTLCEARIRTNREDVCEKVRSLRHGCA